MTILLATPKLQIDILLFKRNLIMKVLFTLCLVKALIFFPIYYLLLICISMDYAGNVETFHKAFI